MSFSRTNEKIVCSEVLDPFFEVSTRKHNQSGAFARGIQTNESSNYDKLRRTATSFGHARKILGYRRIITPPACQDRRLPRLHESHSLFLNCFSTKASRDVFFEASPRSGRGFLRAVPHLGVQLCARKWGPLRRGSGSGRRPPSEGSFQVRDKRERRVDTECEVVGGPACRLEPAGWRWLEGTLSDGRYFATAVSSGHYSVAEVQRNCIPRLPP